MRKDFYGFVSSDPNQVPGEKAEPVGVISQLPSGAKTGDQYPGLLYLATAVLESRTQSQFERC